MSQDTLIRRTLEFDDAELARELFGPRDSNVSILQERSGVTLNTRGAELLLESTDREAVEMVGNLVVQLYGLLKDGHPIFPRDVEYGYRIIAREPGTDLRALFRDTVFVVSPRKTVVPKTLSQRDYISAIRENDMVFGIGPAGTGKTYLAVAMALSSLLSRQVKRIILTRPAVEAGERLGFLPGDLEDKVNPYLRPLYDALNDMLDFRKVQEMLEGGVIEVAPLAFMRGRTLNDAFIILDEAQNTTPEQMKMFLTRLGFGSKAVVTGDITQIDLPRQAHLPESKRSGLVHARSILNGVNGLRFIEFHKEDVIRHDLVARIVQAYEHSNEAEES